MFQDAGHDQLLIFPRIIHNLPGTIQHPANDEALKILDFWFPDDLHQSMDLWFGKSPATDKDIDNKFGNLVEEATSGQLDWWQDNPLNCLALVILLDQFPRNIYRHTDRMYDQDDKAQGLAVKAIYHNYHQMLGPKYRVFLPCIVLTHAENTHLQVTHSSVNDLL